MAHVHSNPVVVTHHHPADPPLQPSQHHHHTTSNSQVSVESPNVHPRCIQPKPESMGLPKAGAFYWQSDDGSTPLERYCAAKLSRPRLHAFLYACGKPSTSMPNPTPCFPSRVVCEKKVIP